MNKDEILNMKTGRELDALVAEKVLDWKYVFYAQPINLWVGDIDGTVRKIIPNYSTDILLAIEVLELFDFYSIDKVSDCFIPQYEVTVESCMEDGTYNQISAKAKNIPEAICKACLIAKLD